MSLFLRLPEDVDKALALRTARHAVAAGAADPRVLGVVVGRRSSVVGLQSRPEIAGAVCPDPVCLAND